jgi:hypothetical protein
MEPERPKVDRAEVGFLKSEALHPADFTTREDEVVRLNPELGRRGPDVAEWVASHDGNARRKAAAVAWLKARATR